MGKLDRRHSMKMKRREAQAKKKLRHMRPLQKAALAAAAAAPAKKARARTASTLMAGVVTGITTRRATAGSSRAPACDRTLELLRLSRRHVVVLGHAGSRDLRP